MDDELLYKKLQEYSREDFYPFHMPGHKRREFLFDQSYSIDITEIDGFDDLHHPEGILKQKMEAMAESYGSDSSYYLINGSTCGILTAISAVTDLGDEILIARNCHKSVFHGVFLRKLRPYYIYPQVLQKQWINGGISPSDVEKQLKDHPNIRAVVIVSPTYEGIVSNIKMISEITHQFGIPLLVDEAHGAHFSYGNSFPKSALNCGADVVIQSLHKTLPALTQAAVLHMKQGLVKREKIEQYLQIYQTSSPSYLLMASIDACFYWMEKEGAQRIKEFCARLERFYKRVQEMKHIWLLSPSVIGSAEVFDFDCSKLVIGTDDKKWTGDRLAKVLRQRFHLEMEMCTPGYVLGMTSLMDTEEGIKRLGDALEEVDQEIACQTKPDAWLMEVDEMPNSIQRPDCFVYTPYEASLYPTENVKFSDAMDRISQEMLYLYPPGIPILVPGEKICQEDLLLIEYYQKKGFHIKRDGSCVTDRVAVIKTGLKLIQNT